MGKAVRRENRGNTGNTERGTESNKKGGKLVVYLDSAVWALLSGKYEWAVLRAATILNTLGTVLYLYTIAAQ